MAEGPQWRTYAEDYAAWPDVLGEVLVATTGPRGTHAAIHRLIHGQEPWLVVSYDELVGRSTDVYLSSASPWEVAIKLSIGKLKLSLEPDTTFASVCAAQGFRLSSVDHDDAWAVLSLPASRADPFDRLIAATARRRGWTVVTADAVFDDLDVPTLRP